MGQIEVKLYCIVTRKLKSYTWKIFYVLQCMYLPKCLSNKLSKQNK